MNDRNRRAAQSGFTLLEMLVVLAIIAAVVGVGVQVLGGVTSQSQVALARGEMDQIASAIQRFRADTGYWPKEGLFDVDGGKNPADLSQLRTAPKNGEDDILPFDRASGTGWNGPYIRELDAATVVSGGDLGADGTGNPSAGSQDEVSGIGDPFEADSEGRYFVWSNAEGVEIARLGRPYLYFIDDETVVAGCQVPCLVSMGPNGAYDSDTNDPGYSDEGNDDIVVNIAGHQ